MKYPLVLVIWKDAQSSAEWESRSELEEWAEKDYIVSDIGWVVLENKKNIVICSQIGSDKSFGNKTKIPVGWVIKKQRITFHASKNRLGNRK